MPELFCTFKPAGHLEANSGECSDPIAGVGFAAVTKHSMSAAAACQNLVLAFPFFFKPSLVGKQRW